MTVTDVIDLRPDAARKRLRECHNRADACEAIREIISNLLGCEEMALFQLHQPHHRLSLLWSFGIDPHGFHLPERFQKAALPRLIAGESYIHNDHPHADCSISKARALVPIKFNGATAAALALLRLLPQKTSIDELDRTVFDVVSAEAGKPLFGLAPTGPAHRERIR